MMQSQFLHDPAADRQGRQAMSLLQYTTAIGNAIRRSPELYSAWIVAELSDVRINGGHCYMELVEKNAQGATVAKIRAMIWSSALHGLRTKFLMATGRDIATGLKVMVQGTAGHHPAYGLSLTINDIDPSYTMGDIERLRREILERLHREGLLERNRRLQMPVAPQRIAVISAAGAAGYGDFIDQLTSNTAGYVFYPHLFPAVMQGERTAGSVMMALEAIEMTIDLWDCVVIIRGGGATTDMNGFDDYALARAVATFPLPVIVGIGHERDRCVLDEIAHTRCKTPTAVAGFLTDTLGEAWLRADRLTRAITQYAADRLKGESQRLAQVGTAIPSAARNIIERSRMRIDHHGADIRRIVDAVFDRERLRREHYIADLKRATANAFDRERRRLDSIAELCAALSPMNTLRRGYSITRVGGKSVSNPDDIADGTLVETQLANGTLYTVKVPGSDNTPDSADKKETE